MKKSAKSVVIVLALVLVVLAGYIASKKGTKRSASSFPPTSQSNTPQTESPPFTPEDLTVTGVVNGHMTQGRKGDTYVCLPSATGPIVGKIGNFDYLFEFRALDAKGPGTYSAFVQIGPLSNPNNIYYGSSKTNLTINDDKRSGIVEGNLENLSDSTQKVHISGSWTCPPDF